MFQKALQFQSTIVFCYNKQTTMRVIGQTLPPLTWQIFQTIVDCFSPIVFACVFNQSHGHWLLSDALHSTISMNLKLKKENQVLLSFKTLMDDDLVISYEFFLGLPTLEGR
jgi:hypothetical protein